MAKKFKKMVAMMLAAAMVLTMLAVPAFAAEETEPQEGTIPVASLPGGDMEDVDVSITVEEDGSTTTTEVKTPEGGDETESGLLVKYESEEKVVVDENGNPVEIEGKSEYTAENSDNTYKAEGGSETTTEEKPASDITVQLSTTTGESNTAEGAPAGTVTETGDSAADREDGIYDYIIDADGHGVTLILKGPGSGLVYMEAGEPVNESELFLIEVNLPTDSD